MSQSLSVHQIDKRMVNVPIDFGSHRFITTNKNEQTDSIVWYKEKKGKTYNQFK